MDLYSRKILSWNLQESMTYSLIRKPLESAISYRFIKTAKDKASLIFHSDRGVQYSCIQLRNLLQKHKIQQSMSSKGNCYDNAVAESFFKTFKRECGSKFVDKQQARVAIFQYIDLEYNKKIPHSFNKYLPPEEKEVQFYLANKN